MSTMLTKKKEVEAAEIVEQAKDLAKLITSFLKQPDALEFAETRREYIKHLAGSNSELQSVWTALKEANYEFEKETL